MIKQSLKRGSQGQTDLKARRQRLRPGRHIRVRSIEIDTRDKSYCVDSRSKKIEEHWGYGPLFEKESGA